MEEPADEDLMAAVAGGDERAFRRLADRHLGRILRLARKTLGSAAEADDVAQEALLRIWTHAARWRPQRSALATWIYTITYRLCLDRLRLPRALPLDQALAVEDPALAAPEALSRAAELRRLDLAMRSLSPRQRAALTLFYYEDLAGAEAAAVLGLGLRAYWSLLDRARQTVRERLRDTLGTGEKCHDS